MLKRTDLKAMGGSYGRNPNSISVFVNECNDRLWLSNSYYLVDAQVIASLWAEYNMDVKPGKYEVTSKSIVPMEGNPPKFDSILANVTYHDNEQLSHMEVGKHQVLIEMIFKNKMQPHYVFKSGLYDDAVALNRNFYELVAYDDAIATQETALKAVAFWTPDTHKLQGLVMPVKMN